MKNCKDLADYQYARASEYLRHLRLNEIKPFNASKGLPNYAEKTLGYEFIGTMQHDGTVYRLFEDGYKYENFYDDNFSHHRLYYEFKGAEYHDSVEVIYYKEKPFCIMIHEDEECNITHILDEEVLEVVSKLYIEILTTAVQNNLDYILRNT